MDIYVPTEVKEKVLARLLSHLKALPNLRVEDFIGDYRFVLGDYTYVMKTSGEKLWIRKENDYLEIVMMESEEVFEFMGQIYRIIYNFEESRNKGEDIMKFLEGLL